MSLHPQSIQNQSQNNALALLESRAGAKVTSSIQSASDKTGVDFAYLMQQASAESSFQVDVKAKTSSAEGLFQFIDSTWISMVDKHGAKYGIDTTQSKSELLDLRSDPKISSFMAGELAKENESSIKTFLGQDFEVGSTELYFAHFMGASRASGFLQAHNDSPYLNGADLFPKEARANKNVFYDVDNRPRTLAEIYDKFDKKFAVKSGSESGNDFGNDSINIKVAENLQSAKHTDVFSQKITPTYSNNDPFDYMDKVNSYMDLLAPSTPILRKSDSSISSLSYFMKEQYGLGNLIKDPAQLLWLAQLDDDLG